ncbi:M20/M25/M40 family metallo-hydrolase [Conexibacter sp. DBS9H8]|uniref:M20/M25/M40 family metallo-hydrolase n=1 Tax=Conexibacter sp. DBS9H8 TaxID=2937801 RepID=UPI00200D7C76|nr:M20/M25/M40 family metallo-hydrolase [Conexibacter sp. DBS9H8]
MSGPREGGGAGAGARAGAVPDAGAGLGAVPEAGAALPPPPGTPLELFLALSAIPSPSGAEGALAGAIERWLGECGLACVRDGAAALTGSDTGNLIVRRPGRPGSPTVLFVAHLDTVQEPGEQIVPVLDGDGVIHSAGPTILGADNQAAVAALLSLLARPRPEHANLIAVFSTCEERGRMGVTALDPLAAEVDLAFPVDGSSPVGTVLESALGQVPFRVLVGGRRAHAAKDPAAGRHAVQAACEIVAGLELGWVGESVLNISAVHGGSASNIVPDRAELVGEARAFTASALAARIEQVRAVATAVGARREVSVEVIEMIEEGAPPFPPGGAEVNLALVTAAADRLGLSVVRESCSATLEANFLAGMGLATLGIASGGRNPHSVQESLPAVELEHLTALLDGVLAAAGEL